MAEDSTVDRYVSRVIAVCALVVVVLLIEARIVRPPPPPVFGPTPRVELLEDWRTRASESLVEIDSAGRIEVAVFTDFECPFCARLDSVLEDFKRRRPADVRRAILHYPLNDHRAAFSAALAFECAAGLQRPVLIHGALFRAQRAARLAASNVDSIAKSAPVQDSGAYERCRADSTSRFRVFEGIELGRELQISGTPTAIVGGWIIVPSTPETVIAAIEALLAGDTPKLPRR